MQEYLTIGEFAKLHNVNQKSLRYYEQIGALVPAGRPARPPVIAIMRWNN